MAAIEDKKPHTLSQTSALWLYALSAIKTEAVPLLEERLFIRVGRTLLVQPHYVQLFCYKLDPTWHQQSHFKESPKAHVRDDAELTAMESGLSVSEITAYREQAERLLLRRKQNEDQAKRSRAAREAQLAKERSQRSWSDWWNGTALPSESSDAKSVEDSTIDEADARAAEELRSIYEEARSKEFKASWEVRCL